MNLILKKPLAIFDLETTGINITRDRIVEIAIVKIYPDGSEETLHRRVNPGIPIPPEITAIHGISNEDVAREPTFEECAKEITDFIGESDLGGYNSNKFDIPVLAEELMRVGSDFDVSARKFVDVQNIFHKMEQRTLSAAYQFYCTKSLDNAHSALYDTKATWEVLQAQIKRYPELNDDIDFLADFSKGNQYNNIDFAGRLARNEDGDAIYNFGKHKGKTVKEILKSEPGYYGWMLDADFPLYTKQCLRKEVALIKEEQQKAKHQNQHEGFDTKLNALQQKFKKE
jgi:DNA polymerase-3 subunit epsilon